MEFPEQPHCNSQITGDGSTQREPRCDGLRADRRGDGSDRQDPSHSGGGQGQHSEHVRSLIVDIEISYVSSDTD